MLTVMPKLPPNDIAFTLNKLAQDDALVDAPFWRHAASLLEPRLHEFSGAPIGLLANAFARTNMSDASFFRTLSRELVGELRHVEVRQIALTVNALANLRHRESGHETLRAAVDLGESLWDSGNPQDVSMLASAMGKVQGREVSPDVIRALQRRVSALVQSFALDDLSLANICNAYAKLNVNEPALFELMSPILLDRLPYLTHQGVAMVANAFARFNIRKKPLFYRMQEILTDDRSKASIDTISPHSLSTILNAFAKLYIFPPHLLHAATRRIYRIAGEFDPQGYSNVINAYARFHGRVEDTQEVRQLFLMLSQQLVRRGRYHDFTPQNMANILNGLSRFGVFWRPLYSLLADELKRRSHELNQLDLANVANAYARVQERDEELMIVLCRRLPAVMREMKPFEIVAFVHSLGLLLPDSAIEAHEAEDEHPTQDDTASIPDVKAAVKEAVRVMLKGHGERRHERSNRPLIDSLRACDISILLSALAKLGYFHRQLTDQLVAKMASSVWKANAIDLSLTLNALGRFQHQPPPDFLTAMQNFLVSCPHPPEDDDAPAADAAAVKPDDDAVIDYDNMDKNELRADRLVDHCHAFWVHVDAQNMSSLLHSLSKLDVYRWTLPLTTRLVRHVDLTVDGRTNAGQREWNVACLSIALMAVAHLESLCLVTSIGVIERLLGAILQRGAIDEASCRQVFLGLTVLHHLVGVLQWVRLDVLANTDALLRCVENRRLSAFEQESGGTCGVGAC
ncbi:unnamed protein product [Vitrella brassicaformis CCMP3155]|uniref:RNA-editing substrate-binding complex 6 protein domain-containing protein n=3 Tax=Vitrella brassicaformis TaxID=1169539 RepID=A0A0G4FI99_VITBC|nr:unnamed protein product [Vitrella brassicaformis CCMP3155]|eukprot:CEM13205.1 unnamed protein product [Vitrella brassicaformis CCMP3155]